MSKWTLCGTGYDREQVVTDGNRFLCANGYMGIRGVYEEADSSLFPAITLAGVYDQYQDRWREPVNAPHCLYARVVFNGKAMAIGAAEPVSHSAGIDYGDAMYHRDTDFGPVVIRSDRFVSMAETHLLCDRIELHFAEDGVLAIYTGISTDIWDINGPHLFDYDVMVNHEHIWNANTQPARTPMTYFDFEGRARVEITMPGLEKPVESAKVLPLASGIEPMVKDGKVSFVVTEPGQYTVVFNDSVNKAMHIFANPLETDVPDPNDPNVFISAPANG